MDAVPTAFGQLLTSRNPTSVALSGGTTARGCYEAVARHEHDWSATAFWFGDERFVPISDSDSNEGMARAVWLDGIQTSAIHSMATAGSDPESAARNYEADLRTAPPLGIVHLGLGPDGHTASLFPGSPTLSETERWVVAAGDDAHPRPRLTVTFAALASAELIVVTVAGAEKQAALRGVWAGSPLLPASRLVTDAALAAKTLWLIDEAAVGSADIPR